jgi:phosphatidylserine decarboxylase
VSPAVLLQYVLPHRFLSSLAYRLARSEWRPLKRWLITTVVRKFNVNLAEAANPDPESYPSFNAFFTRPLKAGARVADADPKAVLCPADGKIAQMGRIEEGRLFQAKGQHFTAAEFLADEAKAEAYRDGWFANVYLSPRDYHRVHMSLAGTLVETAHVPGRLFSVAPWAARAIPRLFARNERLVCHFEGEHGPFVAVMVGAILVSGVETVWSGEEIPAYADRVIRKDWRGKGITLARFAEMARFNYGSTVVLLFPKAPVVLGQRLGTLA